MKNNNSEKMTKITNEIVRKVSKIIMQKEEFFCDEELSHRYIMVLKFIELEHKTMGEIAESLNLTAGSTTTIVDKMIKEGFLTRERNEELDRRKVFISLGDRGINSFNKLKKGHNLASEIILDTISKEEQDILIQIMNKVNKNI